MADTVPTEVRGWVPGAVTYAVSILLIGFVGMGIISDCQSDATCLSASCQDACATTFLWRWAFSAAVLAVVAGVSIRTLGRSASVAVAVGGVALVVLLIALR